MRWSCARSSVWVFDQFIRANKLPKISEVLIALVANRYNEARLGPLLPVLLFLSKWLDDAKDSHIRNVNRT